MPQLACTNTHLNRRGSRRSLRQRGRLVKSMPRPSWRAPKLISIRSNGSTDGMSTIAQPRKYRRAHSCGSSCRLHIPVSLSCSKYPTCWYRHHARPGCHSLSTAAECFQPRPTRLHSHGYEPSCKICTPQFQRDPPVESAFG